MFRLHKILLPVDFSDRCALVVPVAARFARQFDAEIDLLHIAPLFPDRTPAPLVERLDAFGALYLGGHQGVPPDPDERSRRR
jgi:nucleotide-binding universal stress UspA family protein